MELSRGIAIQKEMEAAEAKMSSYALFSWACYIVSMGLAYYKYGFPLCGILVLFGIAMASHQRWYEARIYFEYLQQEKLAADESAQ